MKMRWSGVLLMWLLLVAVAEARLGETVEELAKRFGRPVLAPGPNVFPTAAPPWDKPYEYEKDGFRIRVHLVNGRCEYIAYSRKDRHALTKEQALALRQANDPGSGWVPVDPPKYYYSSDYKPSAAWYADSYRRFAAWTGSMIFYSKTWVDAVTVAKATREAAKAKKQEEAKAVPKGF